MKKKSRNKRKNRKTDKFRKDVLAVGIGVVVVFGVLAGLEAYYGEEHKKEEPAWHGVHKPEPDLTTNDENLSYKNAPSRTVKMNFVHNSGKLIYQKTYRIDQYGRRIVPGTRSAERFIAYFGCSFLFGEGVEDNETLPYYVNKSIGASYRPYNYGVDGYGLNHVLAKIESGELKKEIRQKKGIGVYVYIGQHVGRTLKTLRHSYRMTDPYFELDDNGKLKRVKSFQEQSPLKAKLFGALGQSKFLGRLGVDWPKLGDAHFDYICRMVAQSKQEFIKQFPGSKFYMVFHPLAGQYEPELRGCLKKYGVKAFSYSKFKEEGLHLYAADRHHPSPEANKRLARLLVRDMRIKK